MGNTRIELWPAFGNIILFNWMDRPAEIWSTRRVLPTRIHCVRSLQGERGFFLMTPKRKNFRDPDAASPRRLPQIKATPSNPPTHSVRSSPSSLLASSVGSCLAQCDSGPHPRHTSRLEATYRVTPLAPIHVYFLQRGLRFDSLKGINESLGLAASRK